MNFLKETIEDVANSGHKPADIVFIGSAISGHRCTWEEFVVLANSEYDDGFGSSKVATDLIIVFSDGGSMHRAEYDGSEWWDIRSPFKEPADTKEITVLLYDDGCWVTLADINGEERQ